MKLLLTCFCFMICGLLNAQDKDQEEIRRTLASQSEAWNKGDLEAFMVGYWNNDSLMFVGQSGVTYGYTNTLENYKKGYPGKDKMGSLFFDILQIKRLSADHYFVLGKWFLKRDAGDIGGHYTLLFRKINGKWLIVSDHSS